MILKLSETFPDLLKTFLMKFFTGKPRKIA